MPARSTSQLRPRLNVPAASPEERPTISRPEDEAIEGRERRLVPDLPSDAGEPPVEQLLISRKHTRRMLGDVSTATLQRLERDGILRPIRLNRRSPVSQVFYTPANVAAAAKGGRR
jgi:hypothetical protein